jgi:uncharacterized membrane protein YbaN (DUF454 family)
VLSPAKRAIYLAAAIGCIVLGIVGWLLPIVTGVPFWIAGIWLLGMSSSTARHAINHLEERLPLKTRLWLRRRLHRKKAGASRARASRG